MSPTWFAAAPPRVGVALRAAAADGNVLAVERVPVTPRVGRYTTQIFLEDRKYFC